MSLSFSSSRSIHPLFPACVPNSLSIYKLGVRFEDRTHRTVHGNVRFQDRTRNLQKKVRIASKCRQGEGMEPPVLRQENISSTNRQRKALAALRLPTNTPAPRYNWPSGVCEADKQPEASSDNGGSSKAARCHLAGAQSGIITLAQGRAFRYPSRLRSGKWICPNSPFLTTWQLAVLLSPFYWLYWTRRAN